MFGIELEDFHVVKDVVADLVQIVGPAFVDAHPVVNVGDFQQGVDFRHGEAGLACQLFRRDGSQTRLAVAGQVRYFFKRKARLIFAGER